MVPRHNAVFVLCLLFAESVLSSAGDESPAPDGWLAEAQRSIAQSEYFIRPSATGAYWQSPNRAQNLRIRYKADGFAMEPRVKDEATWTAELTLQTVSKGGASLPVSSTLSTALFQSDRDRLTVVRDGFEIEYINAQQGMRQNFIVHRRPAGRDALRIRLAVSGSVAAISKGRGNVVLSEWNDHLGAYENRVWYRDLKCWDADDRRLPSTMVVSNDGGAIDLVVNDADARYPVTVDPISTTAATTVEADQDSTDFGFSVSGAGDVDGDGYCDVIVGAPRYDNGNSEEGAAFVYHGSASGVSTSASAQLEINQDSAYFGYSVSGAGDVNGDGYADVIVGAYEYDSGQVDEGAAFVFHGSGSGVSTTAADTLQMDDPGAYFGWSVSGAGDVNADGYSDVIVGGWDATNTHTDEGCAFVYHGSSSGVSTTAASELWGAQITGYFGSSVSAAGDVNGDGYGDVIVGARTYNNGVASEGAAFVFHGSSSGVSTTATSTMSSSHFQSYFGSTVAGAGDVNGDGYADVIVGAEEFTYNNTDEGAAFVYHGSSSGVSETAADTLYGGQDYANFGISVSGAGDVDGDGYADVIIGAYNYDDGQTDEGRAYIYYGTSSGISSSFPATVVVDQAGANHGRGVSGAGDVNGDGYSDVIVGTPKYDNGNTNEGAASIYHGSASGVSTTAVDTLESDQASANFGSAVSDAGDVNGDGYADVIVGAYSYDNGQTDEGAAFVFHGSASGLPGVPDATLEADQASASFGYSVSCAGDVNNDGYDDVIVGAYGYDNGETDEGVALVYHGSVTGLSTTASTTLEPDQAYAAFGSSVSGAGDVNGDGYADVIVGATFYDNPISDQGAALVYHGSSSGVSTTAAFIFDIDEMEYVLGGSVDGAGDANGDGYDDVIVGAHERNKAYVLYGSASGVSKTSMTELSESQTGACFGYSVSGTGDVNNDGYDDVIVGAYHYDEGQTDEGAAFVYHGSSSGVSSTYATKLDVGGTGSYFGCSVSEAGDVNADGYADVIVGGYGVTSSETDEGMAYVYHGSSSGVAWAAYFGAGQAYSYFGKSVSGVGDINGDGYDDVVAGADQYDNGQTNEGAVFSFYGGGGGGTRANTRQYLTDLSSPLASGGKTDVAGQAGISLYARSFAGRMDGRLVYEYKEQGEAFSGSPPTTSISSSGQDASYTDLGTAGTELQNGLTGLTDNRTYQWRARIQYDPVTAHKGQQYGRWHYMPHNGHESEGFRSGDVSLDPPTTQATNVLFSSVAISTMTVSWTRGDGAGVAVFMKDTSSGNAEPLDNTIYTANTAFGSGTEIESTGWYCIYNGTGTTVDVTGLNGATTYRVMAFEYSTGNSSTNYLITEGTGNPASQATVSPTMSIAADLAMTEANLDSRGIIATLDGTTFVDGTLSSGNFTVSNLPTGCTVESVSYTDATHCTVNLAFDGTDFDSDVSSIDLTIAAAEVSHGSEMPSTNTLGITATNDAESITIADDGDIPEAVENGEIITVTLSGGTFASSITASNWTVTNLPAGVDKGSVSRVDDTHVTIALSGSAAFDYDNDVTDVTVECAASEYVDATGGSSLSVSSGVTLSAFDDAESIAINDDGYIEEGYEDGEEITVILDGGFFNEPINEDNWSLSNLPDGVSKGTVTRMDDQEVIITLSGNRTGDYDVNITDVTVSCTTDEYVDATGGSSLSASTGVTLYADNDDEYLSLSDNGILEGEEDGKIITVSISGGVFASTITAGNWTVTNLPTGVSKGAVARANDTQVTITLSGNRTVDYDTDINDVTVECTTDEYVDATGNSALSVATGVYIEAVDETPSATIAADQAMTEANLDVRSITVTIAEDQFSDATLSESNFTLTGAPSGCTVESVSYTDATHCDVNLAHDGTDFDSDYTALKVRVAAAELVRGYTVTSTNGLTVTATDDAESITISDDGSIVEGAESGEIITVTISGGTFRSSPIQGNWTLTNLPTGVSVASVSGVDATHVSIALSGNASDYDNDITDVTVTCATTEYYDATGGSPLSASSGVTFTATDDAESITISDDDNITEGAEDGETIMVYLSGGDFASTITADNWTLTNLPSGVSKGSVTRVNDQMVSIVLSGNRAIDYDSDITNLTVTCTSDEFLDPNGVTELSVSTGVTFTAVVEPATITIAADQAMTESNLDARSITVTVADDQFADNSLTADNFSVTGSLTGVSVESVTYTDATHCAVNLAFDGTDFDSDVSDVGVTVDGTELAGATTAASSNQLSVTATDDAESITLADDGNIVEGAEDGEAITVTLIGGTFSSTLTSAFWTLSGLPGGVGKGTVSRVDDTHVTITLSGNRTTDYDTDITTMTVECETAEYADAAGGASLSASTGVTFTATVEAVVMTIAADQAMTESNLDSRSINVTIDEDQFIDNSLSAGNFTLTGAPSGLSVESVVYTDATHCVVNLAFDGTDFDSDVTALGLSIFGGELVSLSTLASTNQLTVAATDDAESIAIADDGSIVEGAEDGEVITVTLTGGTFASTVTSGNWSLGNLPAGVDLGAVTRVDASTVTIALSGNSTTDYDSDITDLSVRCSTTEYDDATGGSTLVASSGVTLSATIEPPQAPSLAGPADGAVEQPLSLQVSWNSVSDATSYRVQVSTESDFGSTVVDDSTVTAVSLDLSSLSAGTTYYWRVCGRNAGGDGPWPTSRSFATVPPPPAAPTLVSPTDNATSQPVDVTLTWNAVAGAETYRVQFATVSNFSSVDIDSAAVTDTVFAMTSLTNETQYFWRVLAVNAGGSSSWSTTFDFTTIVALPEQVALVTPTEIDTVKGDTAVFVWNLATSSVTEYWLEIATDSLMSDASPDSQITDTTFLLTPTPDNGTYWWRVRALNEAGWGEYSDVRELVIDKPLIRVLPRRVSVALGLSAQGGAFRFGLPHEELVEIYIYNVLGRTVWSFREQRQPGYHVLSTRDMVLTGGCHIIDFRAGKYSLRKKVQILK